MTRGNLAAASCAQENQLRRAGNLTSYTDGTTTFNAAVNDLNQLSIVNGTPWQYDANGNLINDGRYQYVWDDANRLIGIMDSSTGTVTSFDYDGLGRRLAIGQSDANGNHAETRYLWCGDELCGARNTSGQVLADYYAQGEQHDNYTVSGNRETANSYYLRDQIGSVIGVMDATGTLLGSSDYTSYGMTRSATGQQADIGYAGMLRSPIAGLYLTKYRAYNPAAGRWLSRDPIGMAGGENVYAYVGGDPQSLVDPSGLYHCVYSITTHTETCIPDRAGDPPFSSNRFVSGNNTDPAHAGCQNNPQCVGVPDHGPLPPGNYTVGPQHAGSNRRDLIPARDNAMHHRFGFQQHGCTNAATCSDGCIAATRNTVRDQLNRLFSREASNHLEVVP